MKSTRIILLLTIIVASHWWYTAHPSNRLPPSTKSTVQKQMGLTAASTPDSVQRQREQATSPMIPSATATAALLQHNTPNQGTTPAAQPTPLTLPPGWQAISIEDMIASPQGQQRLQQFQQVYDNENAKPINVYGKVVDQHGNPVVGAEVVGGTMLYVSAERSSGEDFPPVITDAKGLFSFVGFHGARFGVKISKTGYDYNASLFVGWWDNYTPDPSNPAIFTMWKLAGAEPMGHQMFHFLIPCDGTATHINLTAGKIVVTGGDLVVAFVRDPIQIVRGTPFKWTLTLSVPEGGGMIEAQDTYHYVAPDSGYQPAITITADPAKMSDSNSYTKTYYFKSAAGKFYARIGLRLQADFQPPPTFFQIDAYINPSGSKNLEFDPAKTIKPK